MTLRLRANVTHVTGRTKHSVGSIVDGKPMEGAQLPAPAWVELSEEDGAYYLLQYNSEGECFADTWHQTLEEAKH